VRWSMYLLSFCQLLGKGLAMAILNQVGGKTLAVGVLVVDMGVYFLYKLVRGDLRYWLPLPRGISLVVSLIERVAVKVICDFTGFLHARHPYEMGGFYWLMSMMWTQASVFGAIKLKEEFGRGMEEDDVGDWAIKEEDYLTIATMLFLLWLVAISGLIFGSEKEFRKTFYSTRTGRQYNEALFRSDDDEIMMQVFDTHISFNRNIEDEIKKWLSANWNRWYASWPEWLTDELIERIPERLLPGGDDKGVLDEIGSPGGGEAGGGKAREGRSLRRHLERSIGRNN